MHFTWIMAVKTEREIEIEIEREREREREHIVHVRDDFFSRHLPHSGIISYL